MFEIFSVFCVSLQKLVLTLCFPRGRSVLMSGRQKHIYLPLSPHFLTFFKMLKACVFDIKVPL